MDSGSTPWTCRSSAHITRHAACGMASKTFWRAQVLVAREPGQMRGIETCWHMTYLVQRDGALPNQLQEKPWWGTPRPQGTKGPRNRNAQPRASPRRESTAWPGGPVWKRQGLDLEGISQVYGLRTEYRIIICKASGYITGFPSLQDAGCLHDTTLSSWSKRPAPHVPRRLHTATSPLRGVLAGSPGPDARWIPRLSIFLFFPF